MQYCSCKMNSRSNSGNWGITRHRRRRPEPPQPGHGADRPHPAALHPKASNAERAGVEWGGPGLPQYLQEGPDISVHTVNSVYLGNGQVLQGGWDICIC